MGQKTNSNILRLGTNNNEWKSKYFYKTAEESSLLAYQDLQIINYLKQFLNNNGLFLYDYKLQINSTTIYLYISYFSTLKSLFLINQTTINQKVKLKKEKELKSQVTNKRPILFSKPSKYRRRNYILKKYKSQVNKKKYINYNGVQKDVFIEKLLEGLNSFTQGRHSVYLNFQNLNSSLSINLSNKEQEMWKKKLLLLKRYSKNKFFKEAINIILISTKTKNSAQLIADFIAKEFTTLKRHNYFLIFLKRAFNLFINIPFSKINGVKIIIKGRFNGAPRARNNVILIGSVPVQTLGINISHYQSVSFSVNGTFGIKVWVTEK